MENGYIIDGGYCIPLSNDENFLNSLGYSNSYDEFRYWNGGLISITSKSLEQSKSYYIDNYGLNKEIMKSFDSLKNLLQNTNAKHIDMINIVIITGKE